MKSCPDYTVLAQSYTSEEPWGREWCHPNSNLLCACVSLWHTAEIYYSSSFVPFVFVSEVFQIIVYISLQHSHPS